MVMTDGGTDKDKEGQTRTRRVVEDRRRDKQGQGGTDKDREGQTRTRRGIQGQGGAYRDKEGPYDLFITDRDKEGQTRTRRVLVTL